MEQKFSVVTGDDGKLVFEDLDGMQIDRIDGLWFCDGAVVSLKTLGQDFELRVKRSRNFFRSRKAHDFEDLEYGLFRGDFFSQRFELQTSAKTFFPTWLDEGDVFSFDNSMLQVEQS